MSSVTRASPLVAIMLAAALALIPRHAHAERVLVDAGSACTWLANASDPGIAVRWTAESFDDSKWKQGTYGVGYESGGAIHGLLSTTVPTRSASCYTRTHFTVADPAAVKLIALGLEWDDGAIAWINGVEIHRTPQMPPGAPRWDTAATRHESSNAETPVLTPYVDVTAMALPAIHAGDNVLAIGAWNEVLPSTDLVLVPRLVLDAVPAVVRGPYLQLGTPTSVVIRWRTSLQATSRVRVGTLIGKLTTVVMDQGKSVDHELVVTGLQPGTRYIYAIGTTTTDLEGDDAAHSFRTPPPVGTRAPVTAWVLGDSGTKNADARAVRDAHAKAAGGPPDLWLMLGDNAYEAGTDLDYEAAVFDMYPDTLRQSVLWPTIGNHDAMSADSSTQTGVYYDVFTLPTTGSAGGVPSGTEAWYSFDWANVHFICLNSEDVDRGAKGVMADWLQRDLAATTQDWIIAFWHRPPYTKGTHDSDDERGHVEMRGNILPLLEDLGVDLVLGGHSHVYERSFLVDGHYGLSTTLQPSMILDGGDGRESGDGAYEKPAGLVPHRGESCIVAGSSGKTDQSPLDHPVMRLALAVRGSVTLSIDGPRLHVEFLDEAGVVRDEFTIRKQLVE